MGRPHKFKPGDRVKLDTAAEIWDAIIVDYQQWDGGRGRYRIQRLLNNQQVGPAIWVESYDLERTSGRNRVAVSTYKKNAVIPDRGCRCNCCVHVKQRLGDVNWDGTFKGD